MERNHIYRILSILLFYVSYHNVQAGPVVRPSRMVREIYPEVEQDIPMPESRSQTQVCIVGDIVYGLGETVPFEQPCLKCTCSPPDVRCETEICVPQPGCKAIHRSNKCCPDYQCECEYEGRSYGNGERLPMSPGGECWVCYCRGGEVQCAEVGCYTRSDCKPKYVTGQCCPKYDHCPPRDPLSDRIQYTTESQLSSIDDITTFSNPIFNTTKLQPSSVSSASSTASASSASASSSASTDIEEGSGEMSQSSISTASEEKPHTQTNTIEEIKPRPVTPITFSIKEIELKSNNNKRADTPILKLDKGTQTEVDGRPQITIQEVIPPRSEFKPPFVPPIHKELVSISPINPVTFKIDAITTPTPVKSVTELNDLESYASEKTEVYDHPSPVLRIGDQLLFINKGQLVPEKDASTPTPIITLIGAEGLQIGLGSGEIEPDVLQQNEDVSSSIEPSSTSTTPKTKDTESTASIKETTKTIETQTITESVKFISEETETPKPENSEEYIFMSSSEGSTSNDISTSTETSTTKSNDEQEYIPEENPYYPPIPEDIMNLGPEDITTDQKHLLSTSSSDPNTINYTETSVASTPQPDEISSSSMSTKSTDEISVIPLQTTSSPKQSDSKILPEILEIIMNSTQLPKRENQSAPSLEWLKNSPTKVSIPLINENAALPDSILSIPAASDSIEDGTTLKPEEIAENPQEIADKPQEIVDKPQQIADKSQQIADKPQEIAEKIVEVNLMDKKEVKPDKAEKVVLVESQQSKETIELNEETFDSGEYTTKHASLMSNEDASVEAIKNASPEEMEVSAKSKISEVEIIPGYENPIDRVLTKTPSKEPEEKMIDDKHITRMPNNNPKNDVEMIPIDTDKVIDEEKTHEESQGVREDIQKRDVVKKVLKDVFDNPKENIRTDVFPDPDPDTVTDYPDYSNEELNNVKPNENFLIPKHTNNTKIIIHKITTEKQVIPVKEESMGNQENVQKVNEHKEEKSSESLSATTLSVLRDFFKTQFKQYHNSKLTD